MACSLEKNGHMSTVGLADRDTDLACVWVCVGVAYWRSRRPECWRARRLPKNRWLPRRLPPRASPDPLRVALQEGRDLRGGGFKLVTGCSGSVANDLLEDTDQCWKLPPHYCSRWSCHPWRPSLGTHTMTPAHRSRIGLCFYQCSPACFTILTTASTMFRLS